MQAILSVYPVLIMELCLLGLMYVVVYLRFLHSDVPNDILSLRSIKQMLENKVYSRLIKFSTAIVVIMMLLTLSSGFILQHSLERLNAEMESFQAVELETTETLSE